jgi:GntR family transcriptional regulator
VAGPVQERCCRASGDRSPDNADSAFNAEAAQVGATPQVDMLTVSTALPPAEIADRLRVADGADVVVRSRRYLLDGKPVETAISYIPADLAEGTPIADPNPGPGGIYARLEEQGHTLARFTEDVAARMPTPDEIKLLGLRPGVPVFHLIRTAFDADGRPVEVCDTVMAADAYLLSYELPAH